jgi:polysaccharide biosynthesis transport protein
MESDTFSLADALAVVRRHLLLIVAVTLLVAGAAALLSSRQQPLYSATAEVALNQDGDSPLTSANGGRPVNSQAAQRLAQTQAKLASTPAVAALALQQAGVERPTVQHLLDTSSVTADPNADFLLFKVRNRDPSTARDLASAYALAFANYSTKRSGLAVQQRLEDLQTQSDAKFAKLQTATPGTPIVGLLKSQVRGLDKQIQSLQNYLDAVQHSRFAVPATQASQVQPKTTRNVIIGAALGLLAGILLAFLRHGVDSRIHTTDEVRSALSLPVLARIPEPRRALRRGNRLVMVEDRDTAPAEAFRTLRAKLQFALGDARVLLITSALPEEGKSTTAANLAVAFAEAGRNVALVDTDVRRPRLHRFFDTPEAPGLADAVLAHATLSAALVEIEPEVFAGAHRSEQRGGSLRLLPVGSPVQDQIELLTSPALREILNELRASCDIVIVDAPPIMPSSHAVILSTNVDAVLTIIRTDVLDLGTAEELERALATLPVPTLGAVVTGAKAERVYGYAGDAGRSGASIGNGVAPKSRLESPSKSGKAGS